MDMAESVLIVIAFALMIVGLGLTVIPFVPGPLLVWAVGLVFAILNGFERVPYISLAVMTLIMLAGSTTEFWTPLLGLRTEGSSCMATLGSLIGGLAGTFMIPIPIIGTVAGMVIGALLFEFLRQGELQGAARAGGTALKLYLLGVVFEFASSVAILLVFAVSIYLTR
ncbi:MAG: DUF456 domain-containing protein [Anaerolineae bacterium]|nr:DUF456 domain-containing protein [Anaerolineae bacterium]